MKLISQFICDVCCQPINLQDGIVIWDEKNYLVNLFVVHNQPECCTDNTREEFPLSCTLQGFIASNGLREYFSLLVAEEDFNVPCMKKFVQRGLINLRAVDFSAEEFERTTVQIEADLIVRRAFLKRSIIGSVSRFFDDFDESVYFLSDIELRDAMKQDLNGEGPVYM